jgi:hypothetical protein
MKFKIHSRPWRSTSAILVVACMAVLAAGTGHCATYGIQDAEGTFVPKFSIEVGEKEILLKKTVPEEKYRSISLTLNPKNRKLVRNVSLLQVVWVSQQNVRGKPLLFSGPRYDSRTRTFQDSMTRSIALRVIDISDLNLFADKQFEDLFTLRVDGMLCKSSDAVQDQDRTVRMGAGRDISLNVDKSAISYDQSNIKKGEILNVDNRSGFNQTVGVDLPQEGLFLYQKIIRKPEQTKVPRENWDRFTVEADSGIFIVLIPDPDPLQLAQLNGKEIVIRVLHGAETREVIRIPIKTSPDLRRPGGEAPAPTGAGPDTTPTPTGIADTSDQDAKTIEEAGPLSKDTAASSDATKTKSYASDGLLLWILVVLGLLFGVAVGGYVIFFMLPRFQVLEDRLAKNEMFIHGSREAIREELELTKEEILKLCQRDSETD